MTKNRNMRFFTNIMHDPDIDQREIDARFEAYYRHLEAIRNRLPASAFNFASAPWHYDDGEQGLHDSWVEALVIEETLAGERHNERSIQIHARLLGAYHNRRIDLHYKNVQKYDLFTPSRFKHPPSYKTGHGDWLYDEIDVSTARFVIHRVRFSRGSRWLIECEDIEMTATPVKHESGDCSRTPAVANPNS